MNMLHLLFIVDAIYFVFLMLLFKVNYAYGCVQHREWYIARVCVYSMSV